MGLDGYFDGDSLTDQLSGEVIGQSGLIETDVKKLQDLAIAVDRVLRDELEKSGIEYDFAETRILDRRTVGVQGDGRTYSYPAMIEIRLREGVVWNEDFTQRLSNRITNEVSEINRVVYTFATEENPYKKLQKE